MPCSSHCNADPLFPPTLQLLNISNRHHPPIPNLFTSTYPTSPSNPIASKYPIPPFSPFKHQNAPQKHHRPPPAAAAANLVLFPTGPLLPTTSFTTPISLTLLLPSVPAAVTPPPFPFPLPPPPPPSFLATFSLQANASGSSYPSCVICSCSSCKVCVSRLRRSSSSSDG